MSVSLKYGQHGLLSDLAAAIARGESVGGLVARAGAAIAAVCGADFAWVAVSRAGGMIEILATHPAELMARRGPIPMATCLEGSVVERNRPLHSPDIESDRRALLRTVPALVTARGLAIVPLSGEGGPIGVLAAGSALPTQFDVAADRGLGSLADIVSIAVQNWLLRDRLSQSAPHGYASDEATSAAGARERPRVSPREQEVLALLMGGKTYKEVAAVLDISTRTVEHHVERLKLRFQQPRLHGLVGYAIRNGLGQAPFPRGSSRASGRANGPGS